jgi:tetratricopeptide (TPR) repeat protein
MSITATPCANGLAGSDPALAPAGADRVAPRVDADEPRADANAERGTLLDSSIESPAVMGLDMRRQRESVFTRLFGQKDADEAREQPHEQPREQPHEQPHEQPRIGRYLVRGTLGQGGMGKVLRVHDETLGRDVALKVLHDARDRHRQRLLREAQALARLSHPNVVRVYDVDEIDGRLCMAMELVAGTPLDVWQRQPRPWPAVLDVYRQAGRGLAAAHAEGLVHRDFKPANCILETQGTVKVLDFGLARGVGGVEPELAAVEAEPSHGGDSPSIDESSRTSGSHSMLEQVLTRTGTMLGTLAYMSPEQLLGKPADPRSDQFAYCISVYHALFGKRPFPGTTAMSLLYGIQSQRLEPPAARAGLPPVPKWLFEVLRRGLSVAGHQRYADMDALLAALDRGLARRRRLRVAGLGIVLATGLGGALAMGGMLQGERPCDGLREQAMPAWTDYDRRAVGAAIEAAELPEGTSVHEQVEERLDAYAHAWSEARAEACEATWVRREAGEQALARRMACLDERVVHVRAVVEQLADADARTAAFGPAAVDALPPLAPCADVEELLRGPAPVPEALADEAVAIRELVARSWASGATGDDSRGMEAADRAVEAAELLGDAPVLRLEALQNRGHLLRAARRWGEARRDLEAALALAEQSENDARAIDVLAELVFVAGESDDPSVAAAWLAVAVGKLARFEDDPRRAAQRERLEGVVASVTDHLDEAVAAARRAVLLYDALEPRAEGEQIEALLLLGDSYRKRGDLADARVAYVRAQAIAEEGGYLPPLALSLYKLAHLHYLEGHPEAAEPLLERSLALRDAFFGTLSAASIRSRLLLSVVLQIRNARPAAMAQAELARRSFDDGVPAQLRGEVLKQLGRLHRGQRQWREAIDSYREARRAWESVAVPNRVELALLDVDTADCLVMEGEVEVARELYDDAMRLFEAETAPDDPRRAYPLHARGQLLLHLGEREAGIASLRAALELREALARDPSLHAELSWTLGQALGPDLEEALTLATAARETFARIGWPERVAEIDAWLTRPSSPRQRPSRTPTTGRQ